MEQTRRDINISSFGLVKFEDAVEWTVGRSHTFQTATTLWASSGPKDGRPRQWSYWRERLKVNEFIQNLGSVQKKTSRNRNGEKIWEQKRRKGDSWEHAGKCTPEAINQYFSLLSFLVLVLFLFFSPDPLNNETSSFLHSTNIYSFYQVTSFIALSLQILGMTPLPLPV